MEVKINTSKQHVMNLARDIKSCLYAIALFLSSGTVRLIDLPKDPQQFSGRRGICTPAPQPPAHKNLSKLWLLTEPRSPH